jgi:uncharacterized Zn finger protein
MGMGHYDDDYGGWPPYVPVAERRRLAARKLEALRKKGKICQPVVIEGRAIARTFWGKNWCDHLEAYSDYANRLPRGRTYVRNGSVIDLQIAAGKIQALVAGSEVYEVSIDVHALAQDIWHSLLQDCAGKVASLVELLQGRLSSAVMAIVTRRAGGLFPSPEQIDFRCSCPDAAFMCKHVAAVLYGIGARLDAQPELLFLLRGVDPLELIGQTAGLIGQDTPGAPGDNQRLQTTDLSGLFGIELDETPATALTSPSAPQQAGAAVPAPVTARQRASGTRVAAKPASAREGSRSAGKTKSAPKPARTVTARALALRSIPYHMMQSWLKSGALLRTETRGVYQVTKRTEKEIKSYLERRRT